MAKVTSDQQARHLLKQRHNLQCMDLDRHFRAADRLDAYEKRSLDSLLLKEQLQMSIQKYREDTTANADSLQAEDARSRAMKRARKAINKSQKQRKDLGRNH